jgi:hypothetical protein
MPYRQDTEIQIRIAELQTDVQTCLTIGFGLFAGGLTIIAVFLQIIFTLPSEQIIQRISLSILGVIGEFFTSYFTIFFARKAYAARVELRRLRERYTFTESTKSALGDQSKLKDPKIGDVVKLILILFLVISGVWITFSGYCSTLTAPMPETQPSFQIELKSEKYGIKWGDLKITMRPRNAFVVAEHISTNLEIDLILQSEENATAIIVFPESILQLQEWESENISHYEWFTILHGNSTDHVLHQNLTLWYAHEGIFGVNVTIIRIGFQNSSYDDFCFPDIIHIKPYSYLDERRSAQLTNALNQEILGLTIIAVSPVIVQIADMIGQILKTHGKVQDKEKS